MNEKKRPRKDKDEIKEDSKPQPMETEEGAVASSMSALVGIRLANQHPFLSPQHPSRPSALSQTVEAEKVVASSMSRRVGIRLAHEGDLLSPPCPASPVKRSPSGVKAKVKSVQRAVWDKMKKCSPKLKVFSRSPRNTEREATVHDHLQQMLDRVVEELGGNQSNEAREEDAGLGTSSQHHQSPSEPTDVVMEEAQGSSTTLSGQRLSDRARKLGILLGITPPCDDCGCQVRTPSEEHDLTRDRIRRERQRQINAFKRMMLNAHHHRELEMQESLKMSRPTSLGGIRSDDSTKRKNYDSAAEIVEDDIIPINRVITAEIHESTEVVGTEMTPRYNLSAASSSQIYEDTEPNRTTFRSDSCQPRRKLPTAPNETPSSSMHADRSIASRQRKLSQEKVVRTLPKPPQESLESPDYLAEWRHICQQIESLTQISDEMLTYHDSYQNVRLSLELHDGSRQPEVGSSQVTYRKRLPSASAAPVVRPKMTTDEYYAYLETKLAFGNRKLQRMRLRRRHSSCMERRTCSPILEHPAESCFPPFSSLPYGRSHGIESSRAPELRKLHPKRSSSRQMSDLERRLRRVTM